MNIWNLKNVICGAIRSICKRPLTRSFFALLEERRVEKKPVSNDTSFDADGGSRTHTISLPQDFESCASANSATSAFLTLNDNTIG
mgnify:CR=1 FL=1